MRKSRFAEEQMVAVLHDADRASVAKAARKRRVSDAAIYAWRKHFGQMEASDVKRLKVLELENARLKKLLAERDLDIEVLKEINAKNGEPAGAAATGRSRLRARPVAMPCVRAGVSRSTIRYELGMPAKDAPVIDAMKTLSAQHPRYGYRRIRIFLQCQSMALSWSRTHRIWRCASLRLPKRRPRRRIAASRPRAFTPFKANTVWGLGLRLRRHRRGPADQVLDGRR